MKTIYVDIDKTLCLPKEKSMDYENVTPIEGNIQKVNDLYDQGNTIICWTARGTKTGLNWFNLTYQQLKSWNVKFHELRLGKPAYDLLIDDKAINSINGWTNNSCQVAYNGKDSDYEFEIYPGRFIGKNHPCLIIAEIGQNHQGDIEIAKQLIKVAKDSGADVAKFQKSTLESKFNKKALEREYNSKHSWGKTYGEHKRYLEFTKEEFLELKKYAESIGIIFAASGMDIEAFNLLDEIGVDFFKIGSGDTNNFELIEHVSKLNKPIVLSSGMNSLDTIKKSVNILQKNNSKNCLLQCTSSYPLPDNEVNLNVIKTYYDNFGYNTVIGYSGHETGTSITLAAIAMGARVVERHITLDKTMKGNDHECSLEPNELKLLCQEIRRVERAFGNYKKEIQPSEIPCINKLGKCLVTTKRLNKGDIIKKEDIVVKVGEPKGISAENINKILGKKINLDLDEDVSIIENYLI